MSEVDHGDDEVFRALVVSLTPCTRTPRNDPCLPRPRRVPYPSDVPRDDPHCRKFLFSHSLSGRGDRDFEGLGVEGERVSSRPDLNFGESRRPASGRRGCGRCPGNGSRWAPGLPVRVVPWRGRTGEGVHLTPVDGSPVRRTREVEVGGPTQLSREVDLIFDREEGSEEGGKEGKGRTKSRETSLGLRSESPCKYSIRLSL